MADRTSKSFGHTDGNSASVVPAPRTLGFDQYLQREKQIRSGMAGFGFNPTPDLGRRASALPEAGPRPEVVRHQLNTGKREFSFGGQSGGTPRNC